MKKNTFKIQTINYALFVSFFPQLVAGPIERAKNLLPQFNNDKAITFNLTDATQGFQLILIGAFKKVAIADTVAIYVNGVFNNLIDEQYVGLTVLIAIFLFSIQIYCGNVYDGEFSQNKRESFYNNFNTILP